MVLNSENPKVSVIVITYNHETYIRKCMEGILCQKCSFPVEILVSDDASTDSTPEILKEYAMCYPEKIRLTLRKENVGATKNSYDLLMQAKGTYLAFCEGDDFWCDCNKLQLQYNFMESHPRFIGCTHKIKLVDREGKEKKKQRLYWVSEKRIFTIKDFRGIFLPGHVSSLFKRNIYHLEENFSIQYLADRNIGDRTTALLYLAKGDFYQIDRVMSCYRQVAESKGKNLSSCLYVSNKESVLADFKYTLRLEAYAKKYIRQKVSFDYHKCELLLRLFWGGRKQSNRKVLAKRIYRSIEKKQNIAILAAEILWRKISRS